MLQKLFNMSFIEELKNRGYFYQCTNLVALTEELEKNSIVGYIGFDCTAKSLHVGHLMQIMLLRLFQKYNHKPIIVIGGTTTKIGDPTEKSQLRKCLSDKEISQNINGIRNSLEKFIKFGNNSNDAIIVNNAEWLENIKYINFLSNYGRKFSVNRMLTMDSIKQRLIRKQSMTVLEFNYMLLQAYDFYYLYKHFNSILQIGGSDQWGNIITGVEFIKKTIGKEAFGLTTPLITNNLGIKMGKSVQGAIWLNKEQLSPYDYYQFWRNIDDNDVMKFAYLYCDWTLDELNNFKDLSIKDINLAKKKLAYNITELCHGKENATISINTAEKVFKENIADDNLPTIFIDINKLNKGIAYYQLLFEYGYAKSKSAARRLIKGKGIKVNNELITDEKLLINTTLLKNQAKIKISVGKKKHILIKLK